MKNEKGLMKPIEIKQRPLTLEDVIGWVEELEKRIDRMEKHGIGQPDPWG